MYYFVSGGGSLNVAGENMPLAAESLVYLPRRTVYGIKAAAADKNEKIVAVKFTVARAGAVAPANAAPRR